MNSIERDKNNAFDAEKAENIPESRPRRERGHILTKEHDRSHLGAISGEGVPTVGDEGLALSSGDHDEAHKGYRRKYEDYTITQTRCTSSHTHTRTLIFFLCLSTIEHKDLLDRRSCASITQ